MQCTKCGDIVATVAAVLACRTCSEDGTANECRGYEELDSAVALKPQLANRFRKEPTPQVAVDPEPVAQDRTAEEQAAFDEANRLVEQRRIAEAEAFAKAQAEAAGGSPAAIVPGGGAFGGAGAQGSFGDAEGQALRGGLAGGGMSTPAEEAAAETTRIESLGADAPAAEAGQPDQAATIDSPDAGIN